MEEMDWSHTPQANQQYYMTSIHLKPTGEKDRGRPQNTQRHNIEADVKETRYNWGQLERLAQYRNAWHNHMDGLCPRRCDGSDELLDLLIA